MPKRYVIASASGGRKIGRVMKEFAHGHLHSGSKHGPLVHNPRQARAIAIAEARRVTAHKQHTVHQHQR